MLNKLWCHVKGGSAVEEGGLEGKAHRFWCEGTNANIADEGLKGFLKENGDLSLGA